MSEPIDPKVIGDPLAMSETEYLRLNPEEKMVCRLAIWNQFSRASGVRANQHAPLAKEDIAIITRSKYEHSQSLSPGTSSSDFPVAIAKEEIEQSRPKADNLDHRAYRPTLAMRVLGATLRAFLVMAVVITPMLLLKNVPENANQIAILLALGLGAITLLEYSSTFPSLIEFRDAPPFNRIRFAALTLSVLMTTIILNNEPETVGIGSIGASSWAGVGNMLDFPYSPGRLLVLMLPENGPIELASSLQRAAGVSFLVAIATLTLFAALVRFNRWPRGNQPLNVWVNLPRFDPTRGGDVVTRLERDSRFNLILGVILPFLIPALVKYASLLSDFITFANPLVFIWVVAAWAIIPTSLLMRSIALNLLVFKIRSKRASSRSLVLAEDLQTE